ncbi:MAG: lysine--tRNA ligase, partial [Erysipelotrichaceae bacterium]|nr:lysine--tRNA ligase [Erysipelotrichaceae bacterium]
MEREFNDQELVRRQKMEELRQKGIDPFGQAYERTANSKSIREDYGSFSKEELETKAAEVSIAGRIMSKRRMGKMCFMHILDRYGQIQLVINKADVGEEVYELVKSSDIGDIIGIKGIVYRTNPNDSNPQGELSVYVKEYTHLTKALKPLPEKFHGLTDVEERYRRRYVDLIMNEDSRRTAFLRPMILNAIREFLNEREFVEVETPVLTTLLTGASARPFITHHNSQNLDMYLRIALELNLKRLLVGGMERVYEIGRTFRNEGMDQQHNPEFTMMEIYQAYSDLAGMMELTESMYKHIAEKVCGKTRFTYLGHEIDLGGEWKKVSMADAI